MKTEPIPTAGRPFRPGDVVCLRSGGPAMTVEQIQQRGYDCVWIGADGQPHRDGFFEGTLTHWPPRGEPDGEAPPGG